MKIQINTDTRIEGRERLAAQVEEKVIKSLGHISAHVSRVEVYLSDHGHGRNGSEDKRCTMEARLQGEHPTAVTCKASTLAGAVIGAANKLQRSLESRVERQNEFR